MSYPHGSVPTLVPVHPTPLYESAAAALGLLLVSRVEVRRPGGRFALALLHYGCVRFAVELVRRNPRLGPLTQAQWSVVLVLAGVLWWWWRGGERSGRALRPAPAEGSR